jgi:hypothetical protein
MNGHLDVVERLLQIPDVDPTSNNDEAHNWHWRVVERLPWLRG